MKKNRTKEITVPETPELEQEIARVRSKKTFFRTVRSTVYILITVAAAAVLIATLKTPVMKIIGTSMTPSLHEGEIVVALKNTKIEPGDIIAFYYNNKILTKRVIAAAGSTVNITDDGTVYVDEKELYEPYLSEKALGDCNIELPYQVPDGRYFVMGDHRSISKDSRNTAIGCISEEFIIGKLTFKVWPFEEIGVIE